ncbi:MAG: LapA family protein [Thermodesulfobacteriota bacterium]
MQFFYWLALLVVIGIAIFAVQNSTATPVEMKFLMWRFETSLIYTILGSFGLGVLITLLFWIPRAIRASLRVKKLHKEIENLETKHYREGNKPKEL